MEQVATVHTPLELEAPDEVIVEDGWPVSREEVADASKRLESSQPARSARFIEWRIEQVVGGHELILQAPVQESVEPGPVELENPLLKRVHDYVRFRRAVADNLNHD